ncbi:MULTISPECIES: hypothetical protein [Pseudanabaena]|uniref:Uncharacterized protein n=1 Tax=Pseudanabaena catenata USMAC16 TaxID=1855837 RepID=A0A9X4RNF9_9CYAN|nr:MULTISPECIES: hypothetical protein [Pseudanabaena]MDG3497264.1 hypothetical protein [Pseudanabaena catenata USMAC16]
MILHKYLSPFPSKSNSDRPSTLNIRSPIPHIKQRSPLSKYVNLN